MCRTWRTIIWMGAVVVVFLMTLNANGQWYTRIKGSVAGAAAGQFTTPLTSARTGPNGTSVSPGLMTNSPGALFSFRAYPVARTGIEVNYQNATLQERYFSGSTAGSMNFLPTRMQETTGSYLLRLHIKRFEPYVGAGGGLLDFRVKTGAHSSFSQWRETGLVQVSWNRWINSRFGLRVGARDLIYPAPGFHNSAIPASHWVSTFEPFAGVFVKLDHE